MPKKTKKSMKLAKSISRGRTSSNHSGNRFKSSINKSKFLMKKIQNKNNQEMGNFCYPKWPNNMKAANAIFGEKLENNEEAMIQYMAKSMKGKHLKKHLINDLCTT